MRVIAGTSKGLQLKSPKSTTTRPTTDMVKEALFSILESMDIQWNRVLDLFAGSGALGIESLSRGAEQVDFVEQNIGACSVIKSNLEHGGLTAFSRVCCSDAGRTLQNLKDPYDLVFMDPPYRDRTIHQLLLQFSLTGLLNDGGVVVLLHSSRVEINQCYGNLLLIKQRKYGDTGVSIFRKDSAH
ncbi:MAG: 16S rRNA (guanine(966)-N(2))-methyltransferase RsmD [Dehalococcoidia bacterium]|nr:16S rRNA (guanine(966)-N(2))-methyltransferase RsmD [Dehalococcoidia bacterium]MDZ4246410.1 16S rRNA (guanine(966)-N(2))-methyltransferase RsmD [Dehalococcoidia bacterium]